MRLIIADDHDMFRQAIKPHLQALFDGDALEAASYPELFRLLADSSGEVAHLFLDLNMPGMPSEEGLARVRSDWPDIRTVVLSATSDAETMERCFDMGVAGYIPKRMNLPSLIAAAQLVLAGQTYVPPQVLQRPSTGGLGPKSLTPREREVLKLLRQGHCNKGIARTADISEVTVKCHLSSAFRKLGVRSRTQALLRLLGENL